MCFAGDVTQLFGVVLTRRPTVRTGHLTEKRRESNPHDCTSSLRLNFLNKLILLNGKVKLWKEIPFLSIRFRISCTNTKNVS